MSNRLQKEKEKIAEEIHKRTSTANLVGMQIQQYTDAIEKFNVSGKEKTLSLENTINYYLIRRTNTT